ncbi:MAG TPA: chloride channel protein [Methanocorpusculum sp.]|nr:chloride channel protein [Methanocorpusculum sp.]HJJ39870.1 chloride channel protein [Methanocorpusculum sp.]HJJ49177.1 chloride channel protein [Methanocorpusculum sp.]HJJ56835.1 chloride channel protein [Methanocorpusculum sp.]
MAENPVRIRRILVMSILIGIISGFGALLFYKGIELFSELVLGGLFGFSFPMEGDTLAEAAAWSAPTTIWLIIPILMIGALISGLLVWKTAPEAAGHGTDAALKSYHTDGKIRWRVPLVKAVSSILTIGSGGSAGCEGPIVQISAGFGSIISDIFKVTPEERRMAIAIGIGAGVGAIFKAPLGGAILAAEILYLRGIRFKVIPPALLASLIGYGIFSLFEGFTPLFGTIEMSWTAVQLPFFLLLGIAVSGIGFLYVKSFYGTQKLFNLFAAKFKIPKFLKPVIGAGIIGILITVFGYLSPETFAVGLGCLGTGYGFVQLALYNLLPFTILLILPLAKILATSLTIGSGASGGVFAPGLSIGAFAGGALGIGLNLLFPELIPLTAVPVFVIIGMIATFGGVSHAPVAILFMVIEMTWNPWVALPAVIALIPVCILLRKITIFRQQRLQMDDARSVEEVYK